MHCPSLNELPPPPAGKTGWPWTEETCAPPRISEDSYSRISIVTPSYNSIRYLEETIRSVLLQGYPDLEYIVMDGGSTDGSVQVIKKYEKHLAFWVCEPDRGYADAVNKGFARATGNIRAWLPASDLYAPSALLIANRYLRKHQNDLIFGRACQLSEAGSVGSVRPLVSKNLRHVSLYGRGNPCQPATFWRSEIHKKAGQLNANLRYAADSEWFLRLSLIGRGRGVPEVVCFIRQHSDQLSSNLKEMTNEWFAAWDAVVRKQRIWRLRILLGAIMFAPFMRYRSGGLKSLLRIPRIDAIASTFFRSAEN